MINVTSLIAAMILIHVIAGTPVQYPTKIEGDPWQKQVVPGKIEFELYDKGGEGVAYHDTDSINNGSGRLNPANGNFLNQFRMTEGVDISFTKSHGIDENPFNSTAPEMDKLYIGWTKPGEWINYTITVNKPGSYRIGVMYTANGDGAIAFDIDQKRISPALKIPSTHNDADTVAWRQWHHWNKLDSLTSINLKKGVHVLTMHVIENGNMNFDYLECKQQ